MANTLSREANLTQDPQTEVRDLVERGKQRIEQASSQASQSFDHATTAMGRGIERAGASIESAGQSAGTTARRAGRYLQDSNPATMGDDLVELMRRHPGATLCAGIGVGLLVGRMFSPRH